MEFLFSLLFVVLHVVVELVLHVVLRTISLSVGYNHLNFLLFSVFFLGLQFSAW